MKLFPFMGWLVRALGIVEANFGNKNAIKFCVLREKGQSLCWAEANSWTDGAENTFREKEKNLRLI